MCYFLLLIPYALHPNEGSLKYSLIIHQQQDARQKENESSSHELKSAKEEDEVGSKYKKDKLSK